MSHIEHFYFIRPFCLILIPFGIALILWLKNHRKQSQGWQSIIDPKLLPFLVNQGTTSIQRNTFTPILIATWIISCLALAGPSWKNSQQPVVKNQDALVFVLDLTLSMLAEDQKPSRLVAAKRKLEDAMRLRQDGLQGLVVFSGSAHTVIPLAEDTETMVNLLPALNPKIMPKVGNNALAGVEQALSLFSSAGVTHGKIALLIDELSPNQLDAIQSILPDNISLVILTFGTEAGAPIPYDGFLKDPKTGEMILAKLNWPSLESAAQKANIPIIKSHYDDQDLTYLGLESKAQEASEQKQNTRLIPMDNGFYLLFLLLPFILLLFRRGWILLAVIVLQPLISDNTFATALSDLFLTENQQAAKAMESGDFNQAAEQFNNPLWKANAYYQSKKFDEAEKIYSDLEEKSATDYYNWATSLVQKGQYQAAIEAFDQALAASPDMSDAAFNRDIAKALLEQQNQDQQNQKQDQQNQNQDQQNQSQDQQNQNQDQQNQNQDQQNQNQDQQNQNQDQQNQSQDQQNQSQDQQNQSQDQQNQSQDQQNQNQDQKNQSQDQQNQSQDQQNQNQDQQNQSQEQTQDDQSESAQQANQASQEENPADDKETPAASHTDKETSEEKEQAQAMQQWLRQLPDDGGNLLKRKFQHQLKQQNNQQVIDRESEQIW